MYHLLCEKKKTYTYKLKNTVNTHTERHGEEQVRADTNMLVYTHATEGSLYVGAGLTDSSL